MNRFLIALILLCSSIIFTPADATINCSSIDASTKRCIGTDKYGKDVDLTVEERGFQNFYITGTYDYENYYNESLPDNLKDQIEDVYYRAENTDIAPIVDFVIKKAPSVFHW